MEAPNERLEPDVEAVHRDGRPPARRALLRLARYLRAARAVLAHAGRRVALQRVVAEEVNRPPAGGALGQLLTQRAVRAADAFNLVEPLHQI